MSEARVKLAGLALEKAVTVLAGQAMGGMSEREAVLAGLVMGEVAEQAREVQAVPAGLEPEKGQEREVFLYFLHGGHCCIVGDLSHQCGRLLLGKSAVCSDVHRQAGIVSAAGMGGSALYQKTVYGASGGRAGWMGNLCGDDGALLYPVRQKQQAERTLQGQKNTLEAQLESQRNIRKMKHDMKGHTVTLSGLLAAGQIVEAQTYLKGLEESMDTLLGQYCANPYINAVFVHYIGKLEKMGAVCRMDLQIGDEALPHMELCQILSNELENACDALRGLPADRREVSVLMKYNRVYLLMCIQNQCRNDLYVERGTIPPTDKEGHDHGFGLVTVKEAAERLGGNMVCHAENGSFVLEVMIPIRSFQVTREGGKVL